MTGGDVIMLRYMRPLNVMNSWHLTFVYSYDKYTYNADPAYDARKSRCIGIFHKTQTSIMHPDCVWRSPMRFLYRRGDRRDPPQYARKLRPLTSSVARAAGVLSASENPSLSAPHPPFCFLLRCCALSLDIRDVSTAGLMTNGWSAKGGRGSSRSRNGRRMRIRRWSDWKYTSEVLRTRWVLCRTKVPVGICRCDLSQSVWVRMAKANNNNVVF